MILRKLHRLTGVLFAGFFLLTACTGIALLFRKNDIYGKETKELLIGLHNWEIVVNYIGIFLSLALIFMSVTGLMIAYRSRRRKGQ